LFHRYRMKSLPLCLLVFFPDLHFSTPIHLMYLLCL